MHNYRHLILTRFNVRVDYSSSHLGLDAAWLDHRFQIFEQYCYPSVYGQSNQNFDWIVFFDAATPETFKHRIAKYSQWQNFKAIFIDEEFNVLVAREAISQYLDHECQYLITSRLDNDDSLCINYVELIQKAFHTQPFQFVIFDTGYVLSNSKLYKFKYPNNPFLNLIEKRTHAKQSEFKSVLSLQHTDLSKYGPVIRIKSQAGWLQIIHGRNISNRVRGIRYPISVLNHEFRISPQSLPIKDEFLDFWADLLISYLRIPIESVIQRIPKSMKSQLKRLMTPAIEL